MISHAWCGVTQSGLKRALHEMRAVKADCEAKDAQVSRIWRPWLGSLSADAVVRSAQQLRELEQRLRDHSDTVRVLHSQLADAKGTHESRLIFRATPLNSPLSIDWLCWRVVVCAAVVAVSPSSSMQLVPTADGSSAPSVHSDDRHLRWSEPRPTLPGVLPAWVGCCDRRS